MHLILVAEGLLAQPQAALTATPSLAMLAQLAPDARAYANGIAAALLDALEAPQTPIAPVAALGADFDAGGDYVLAADPVLLVADRDDLVLVQRVDDLSAADAATLVALLNRHFGADDLQFVAARPDSWFVHRAQAPAMTTTPLDAARLRGIFPFLPRGADAGRWQRWQNEIGMLLHDHAVNEARQAAGSAPVTGIWFSGGGRLAEANALPSAVVHAAPGRIGDVARGVAHRGGGVSHPLAPDATLAPTLAAVDPRASGAPQPRVIVVDPVATDGGPSALHVRWLAPALELLRRKRLARLTLIADGRGAAVRWTATPPTLRQRVFARIAVKPFGVPVIPNS